MPESFSVLLWRAELDDFPPDRRVVENLENQLRVEGVLPGKYHVRVRPGGNRHYPAGLFYEEEFEVELGPDQQGAQSVLLRQGAGLRVTVRGEDGALVSGEYEFFDHLGLPAELILDIDDTWRSSWKFYPHGTHESRAPLQPGSYRLVLRSPGYAERSVSFELRTGEYGAVDVTLIP